MKKALKLFAAILLYFLPAAAQHVHKVDSLRKALNAVQPAGDNMDSGIFSPSDSIRADILYRLSCEYWSSDLDTSWYYAEQALELSKRKGYQAGTGNAYSSMGVICWYRGKYSEAHQYNETALKIRIGTGDKGAIARSYNNIGLVYDDQGNFPEALKYYLNSLKLNEEIGHKDGIAQAYNNICSIYMTRQNYQEALSHANKALEIRLQTNDEWGLTESYSNLGLIYFELGDLEKAIANYDEALRLRKQIGDMEGIATSYNNYGDVYKKEGNFDKALESYRKALEIDSQMGLKKSMSDVNLSIGKLYEMMGNLPMAVKHGTIALELAKELGAVDYMKNDYAMLAGAYGRMNNYKEAYNYKVLHQQMTDSLNNTEKNRSLTRLQMQYEYDKKHLSDSLRFVKENEIATLKLQRQQLFTFGGFALVALSVMLLYFVYRNYSRQRTANKILKETQQQLIKSEKMAAFGIMASRVAHEIQNPLNFVNNFSELSGELVRDLVSDKSEKEKKEAATSLVELLEKIRHHGVRAGNIVKELQGLSRTGGASKFFEEGSHNVPGSST